MRISTFFILLIVICFTQTLRAVTLGISPTPQVVQSGQTVTVDVVVTDYSDIVAFQFSMNWDPAVLQFQSLSNYVNGLSPTNFNTSLSGGLAVAYYSNTTLPVSLPDGSTIFSIQFLAIGAPGTWSNVTFGNTPTPLFFYDSSLSSLNVTSQSGLINIAAQSGYTISGNIHRGSGASVHDVVVGMTGDATGIDMTDAAGNYLFQNIAAGSDLTLTPSKDIDPLECVSVRDIVFIMKHILGIMPLPSPYQMVAADANKSNTITTADVVEIRKLILGIYNQFPGNTSWRFIDANFVFPNPTDPFATLLPESADVLDVQSDVVQNFIGIKTGDATDCVNDAPAPAFLTLSASNVSGTTGQQVSVDVSVQGFNDVLGLQFSLEWDPALLQFDQVQNLNLNGLTLSNLNTTSGKLSFCWNNDVFTGGLSIPDNTNIFSLQFTILGTGTGVTPVSFVQTPTKFEVVDGDCLPYNLNINNGSVAWTDNGSTLLQLVASNEIACTDDVVCVDISVSDFENIAAGQFSLSWDPSIANFQNLQNFNATLGLNLTNFGFDAANGHLQFTWFDQNFAGVTLPDNSVLFQACYEVTGAPGSYTDIAFVDQPTPIEFIDASLNQLPVQLTEGSISVECSGDHCDSISIAAVRDTSSLDKCCYNLQITNEKPDFFTFIKINVLDGGQLSTPIGVAPGWSLQGFSPAHAYLVPDAGVIGTGASDVAQICLQNLTADAQVLEIEYFDLDYQVVCSDTIQLVCDACVQAFVDSVYCEGWDQYAVKLCVLAGEVIDNTAGSVTLAPLNGVTFSADPPNITNPDGSVVVSLPDLLPGDSSCDIVIHITGATAEQEVCFYAIIHDGDITAGEPDGFCCADTVPICFTLPDCDPCDSTITFATAEEVVSPTDSCCWKITLHNPPDYYIGVSLEITTPGVQFDVVNNFVGSGWNLAGSNSTGLDFTPIAPQGSFIQNGWMLPVVCIGDDGTGTATSPQEIVVSWMAEGSTFCYDTLEFKCPVTETDCATLDSTSLTCNQDGTLSFSFQVTNHSNIVVDYIHLTPAGTFIVNPSDFYITLPPNATSPLLTTNVTGSAAGGIFNFLVSLHEVNDDSLHLNCCTTDTISIQIDDNLPPTCVAPPNVAVTCDALDPDLNFGAATAEDDCCLDTIIASVSYSQFNDNCQQGTIVKTFTALDCAGNTAVCQQEIQVEYESYYFVKFPDDRHVMTCDSTTDYGQPEFYSQECEFLSTTYEDAIIGTADPDYCTLIERTWTIINWCEYTPGDPCTVVPNPNPSVNPNDPANLPGPVVSEFGNSIGGWTPTVSAINPGDPPTDFSTFWTASGNCYQYTQIIKIVDCEPPQLSCFNGLTAIFPPGNPPSITVWAVDFVEFAVDNCTPNTALTYGIRIAGTGSGFPFGQENLVFNCGDQGSYQLEIWVMDDAGNADFCENFLVVQDVSGVCPEPSPVFRLYQNQPNPWSEQTAIRFYIAEASTANLTVCDAVGRIIYADSKECSKGGNEFLLDNKMIDAHGMLYYRVETPTASATMKMIQRE